MKPDLTADNLRKVLYYDPATGDWEWLVNRRRNGIKKGEKAGCIRDDGRRIIGIDGTNYLASRLAVLYMTGQWPDNQVDHRDTHRANDQWLNLRPATNAENVKNRRIQKNNTSGLKGVSWNRNSQKWDARITSDGKQNFLGYFDCPAAAHLAYVLASAKLHGEFGRIQ